jgi:putative ATP-binding cassette transporter
MQLIAYLRRTSGAMVTLAMVAGVVSGASNAALLAWINHALTHRAMFALFAAILVIKLGSGYVSRQWLTRVSQRTLLKLRRDLSHRIVEARLRDVEEIGTPALLAALTDDTSAIAAALALLPSLAVNVTVVIACSVYLIWLSPRAFGSILGLIVIGLVAYRVSARAAMQSLRRARGGQDQLFAHFRALTDGIVELKRHAGRRRAFLRDALDATSDLLERENVRASSRFGFAQVWSQAIAYGAVAAVFAGGYDVQQVSTPIVTGFVLTIVYLTGPLAAAMQSLPTLGRANVALDRIQALGLTLTAEDRETTADASPFSAGWQRIALDGVAHTYRSDDEPFTLGPLSLTIERGEIVFVTGGNGSGKSTLAKIIAGLYEPDRGIITVDCVAVNDANRACYRELPTTVLATFFLFDTLVGLDAPDLDGRARRLLSVLGLGNRVRVEDGRLSTIDLSHGQRKRLALAVAALEERTLFILDEWAADQDRASREWFYLEWLSEVRQSGRTAVVISHDERYFHVADRIVRLERGQLVSVTAPAAGEPYAARALEGAVVE